MTTGRSRHLRLGLLGALVLAIAGYTGHWWTTLRHLEGTDNAYVRADISVLSPKVSGEITALHVRDNQVVKAGDLLLEIDANDYRARVANALATVKSRRADLVVNTEKQKQQLSTVAEAEAEVAGHHADLQRMEEELARTEALIRVQVATKQHQEKARAEHTMARAAVARATAGLAAARQERSTLSAEQQRLEAELAAANAQLELANIELHATQIRAPIAGAIGNLAARLGERVNPNSRLMSLVPPQTLHIIANFKETQIGQMQLGQAVSITVDAFPGQAFKGHIDSLSPASGAEFSLLPATNATGNFTKIVQRIPVRIALDGQGLLKAKLRPGMSAYVQVNTRQPTTPDGAKSDTATQLATLR